VVSAVIFYGKMRGTRNRISQVWPCVLFCFVLCVFLAQAQTAGTQSQTAPAATKDSTPTQAAPLAEKPETGDQKTDASSQKPMSPEEARQAQLVADTNKLFELAQELQAEVAKSSKDTLSLAVVKKAAEVEKLAKSLKERMKTE
jgi:hypothetical protein